MSANRATTRVAPTSSLGRFSRRRRRLRLRHSLTEFTILGCLCRRQNGDHGLADSIRSRPHAMNVPGGVNFSCDDLMRGPLSAEAVAALRAQPLLPNAVCAPPGAPV